MWILNYFALFVFLAFAGIFLCFVLAMISGFRLDNKKCNVYSVLGVIGVFIWLGAIFLPVPDESDKYETSPSHKIYIRQVGNNNMFVGTRFSGNDVVKYQVLTENGEYKEFYAKNTRIVFAKIKKPYIQVYKVQYTHFLGKLANGQFEGKGYYHRYAYSIFVPEDSVQGYVRINY